MIILFSKKLNQLFLWLTFTTLFASLEINFSLQNKILHQVRLLYKYVKLIKDASNMFWKNAFANLPGPEFILSGTILLPDELEEEEVKDEDEEADGEPEDGGKPAQLVAVLVQSDHVVLVGRSWNKWWKSSLKFADIFEL